MNILVITFLPGRVPASGIEDHYNQQGFRYSGPRESRRDTRLIRNSCPSLQRFCSLFLGFDVQSQAGEYLPVFGPHCPVFWGPCHRELPVNRMNSGTMEQQPTPANLISQLVA